MAVCLYLLLVLAACQKQSVWQEQYDLGMRYLSESNYEEAILAFTAAIEIDPNYIDSYIYLIQAQLASGDIEGAEETRKKGYKTTHDEIFQYAVNEYTSLLIYIRNLPFEKRATYVDYRMLSSNEQTLIRQGISLLLSDMNGEYIADTPFEQETYQVCECVDGQYNGEWRGEEYNEYVNYSFSHSSMSEWINVENYSKNKSIRMGQIKDYIITVNTLQKETELTSVWGVSNSEMVYENGKVVSYKSDGVEEEYPYSISDEYLIAHFDDALIRLRYW